MIDLSKNNCYKHGVYCIKNIYNGKMYIGSVCGPNRGFQKRQQEHFNALKRNKHVNKHLQSAWNLYGEKSFEFMIIEIIESNHVIDKEQYWIDKFDVHNNGYNICPKAGNTLGIKFSKEACERRSKARMGKNNTFYGKRHTPETKRKISEIKSRTDSSGTNNHFFGKRHTDNAKQKISAKNKGKPSPRKGVKLSELTKNKIRKHHIGKSLPKRDGKDYKGVYSRGEKWWSKINYLGKNIYLGVFSSKEEAAHNYDYYALLFHGDKAMINFCNKDYTDFTPKKVLTK